MVGGLWRLYNQLIECGLCGSLRYNNKFGDNSFSSSNISLQYRRYAGLDDEKDTESRIKLTDLPQDIIPQWTKIIKDECNLNNNNNDDDQIQDDNNDKIQLENATIQQIISIVEQFINNNSDNNNIAFDFYKSDIISYITTNKIDGKTFVDMSRRKFANNLINYLKKQNNNDNANKNSKITIRLGTSIYREIKDNDMNCNAMKRVGAILCHFQELTNKIKTNEDRYPYEIKQFICSLNNYNAIKLLNDIDHILKHKEMLKYQKYVCCNKTKKECRHYIRAIRNNNEYNSLKQQQDLFNTDYWRDFIYISYLDRIHSLILHSTDLRATKDDAHRIKKYSTFPIYSTGVFIQYETSEPLHINLKQELIKNLLCNIKEHQFENVLLETKNRMNTKKWKKDSTKWSAIDTNQEYGIKKNESIPIENVLCITLYTDNSTLCRVFRESYRSIDYDDNNEKIKKYHTNNFYWFGRYIYSAIQFWGKTPKSTDIFYHGQHDEFLFNNFSTIFEAPTSTTSSLIIAKNKFSSGGIVLKLAPKYKNPLNFSKYLDVGPISVHNDEKERLFAGMTVLSIIDIGYSSSNNTFEWLGPYQKAFLYFERIIDQSIHQKDYYNYGYLSKKIQRQYLEPLIEHQIDRNRPLKIHSTVEPQKLYIFALFEHFCDNKTEYIDLSCILTELNTMDVSIKKIIFHRNLWSKTREQTIDEDAMELLFPNLKGYQNPLGWFTKLDHLPTVKKCNANEIIDIIKYYVWKKLDTKYVNLLLPYQDIIIKYIKDNGLYAKRLYEMGVKQFVINVLNQINSNSIHNNNLNTSITKLYKIIFKDNIEEIIEYCQRK